MLLEEKVVVITGGAGLLGKKFVETVIIEGGIPIIIDLDKKKLERVSKEITKTFPKGKFEIYNLNIISSKSLKNCIRKIHSKYKKIDALVNNAYPKNKNYGKDFFDVKYNDFVENLGTNLGGCFVSSQTFLSYFQKQGHGNIINISSIYGVIAPKFEIYKDTNKTMPIEYAAIKSALIHMSKYMAKYLKNKNIRVNIISPGGIYDNQNLDFIKNYKKQCLNKGMLDKKDLNGALVFLLSDMSKFVNGQNIIVDDGFTL